MSGVAAVLTRTGRVASAIEVQGMLAAVPYRAPDGARARRFGPVVLGHARLIATPSDRHGVEPLRSSRTGCAIVADARLDNRAELIARLGDVPTTEISDAELILRAYERWELDAPRMLLGDFALVIWDPRRQRLVCARDGGGQRTLHYRLDRESFAVASEIHQLLQRVDVPVEANDERIREALAPTNLMQNAKESAATYYQAISSVLPGELLCVTRERFERRRFWTLEPPASIRYRSSGAYVEHFAALFRESVAARLRTNGPIAAALSGGLDSTSIVAFAQDLYRSGSVPNTGFGSLSIVYDGLDCDERPLIQELQARFGFDAHYLRPDPTREWLQLEPGGFRSRPELPTAGLATMLDVAETDGRRVLLTGEVADNVVRGTPLAIDSLLRRGRLRDAAAYLRAYRLASGSSVHKSLALYGVAPLLPLGLQKRAMGAYAARTERLERWRLVPNWLPGALQEDLLRRNLELTLDREARRRYSNETQHQQFLRLDPPEVPTIAAGWPIEIWRPFADRRLHEFLLAIPPEELFAPVPNDLSLYGGSKQLLRGATSGLLPESIRARTQPTQFAASFEQQLGRQWHLHQAVFGPGGRSELAQRGYIDQPRFWERLQALRAGRRGRDLLYVNYMIGLETWLRSLTLPRHQVTTVSSRVNAGAVLLVDEDDGPHVTAVTRAASGCGAPARRTSLALERR
jgi:asparagine synthase (glutamine-hydrolysing)